MKWSHRTKGLLFLNLMMMPWRLRMTWNKSKLMNPITQKLQNLARFRYSTLPMGDLYLSEENELPKLKSRLVYINVILFSILSILHKIRRLPLPPQKKKISTHFNDLVRGSIGMGVGEGWNIVDPSTNGRLGGGGVRYVDLH